MTPLKEKVLVAVTGSFVKFQCFTFVLRLKMA